MKEPTVRTQKIHRNYLKLRLIIFGGLALALVNHYALMTRIYRIWAMQKQFRQQRIYLVRTGMEGICFPVSLWGVRPVFILLYYW